MDEKCLRVGVGFATGRRSFQNVLRSYVYHLEESGFVAPGRVSLTLLVAFDPAYSGTARADYEDMEPACGNGSTKRPFSRPRMWKTRRRRW